jgi:aminopeptidase N
MKKRYFLLPVFALALIAACKTNKGVAVNERPSSETSMFGGISPYARPDYHATAERHVDLLHTALRVQPDWKKRYLYGRAEISARPYFYPTSVAQLDARGMEIRSIRLADPAAKDSITPVWKYEEDVITVQLGRTFSRKETFTLVIDYVAKPNELRKGGSAAISDDRGLFFIDPDDTDPNIPRQFWTQGETQASSAWFPTIDRPNERMTTEIKMHVEPNMVTLSNGVLVSSVTDADGQKVDHWKMDLPHAPYLVMMAAGDFKVIRDTWRGKEVSYYVEPEFEKYGRSVFGKTPQMMEFFSNILGVEYPWAKYSQICAREYVSGAMENTTATVHSDFLQMDDRELLDGSYEEYISHELFHQWFGDYVTSESWSNLPLNESFATYGEYLWIEHAYGREWADQHHYESLQGYLSEAGVPYDNPDYAGKQEPLIRFNYETQEDMFDSHSYNKGGQVLHLLRQYVGDEAFFTSLKLYLETNKFQSVEIHDLRLAFERTTGQDLNWFFNQWFMSPGHPELDITYSWNDKKREQMVIIRQVQDYKRGVPVFRLPLDVDVYTGGKVKREHILLDAKADTFYFDADRKPELVNVDPQKTLLAWKIDHHTEAEWAYQYRHAPTYVDRMEALEGLAPDYTASTATAKTITAEASRDRNYNIRMLALYRFEPLADSLSASLKTIALTDSSSLVRATALYMLRFAKDSSIALSVARAAINDSSYAVFNTALSTLVKFSHDEGMRLAAKYENATHRQVKLAVANAYEEGGSDAQQPWFEKTMFTMYGRAQINFLYTYSGFLKRCSTATVEKAIDGLERLHAQSFSSGTKYFSTIVMRILQGHYMQQSKQTAEKIEQLGGAKKNNPRIDRLKEEQKEYDRMVGVLESRRKALK